MNGYYWEGIENNFIEFKIIFVDSRFIFYFIFYLNFLSNDLNYIVKETPY